MAHNTASDFHIHIFQMKNSIYQQANQEVGWLTDLHTQTPTCTHTKHVTLPERNSEAFTLYSFEIIKLNK